MSVAASQVLEQIPPDFQHAVLSKIILGPQYTLKVAKVTDDLHVEGHNAIAKVIKHKNAGRFARTVIIQNSPEAFRAFGVRNVPRKLAEHMQKVKANNAVSRKKPRDERKGQKLGKHGKDFKAQKVKKEYTSKATNRNKDIKKFSFDQEYEGKCQNTEENIKILRERKNKNNI